MRNAFFRITLVAALVVSGITACDQPTTNLSQEEQKEITTPEASQSVDGQYIVVFNDTNALGKVRSKVYSDNNIDQSAIVNEYNVALKGFTAKLDADQLTRLRNDDRVDYIEKDRIVTFAPPCGTPNGGSCDGGGGGDSQTTPWGITRVGGATASSGTAWIIDSGVDLDHPDLNVDQSRSTTFITQGKDSKNADDGNGHGTHVAGTIAALDNNIDVVGIAAGATVVGVKVLDSRGSGSYSGVIAGVDYVAQNASQGDVANMSLGGPTSQSLDDAIRNAADAGVMMVVAAGNDGDDANNYSPARVEYNNVWTVSAIDDTDTFASFSNYGNPPVEYAAPGVDVLSLWKDGGTNTISGTSMASPHVAGVLLATGGNANTDGTAIGDPDGDADPIVSQ
jgi:subtilisin family serine protease